MSSHALSSDSTRRAIRTAFQVIPAILAAVLVLVPVLGLPAATVAAIGGFVGTATVVVAKLHNLAEDYGLIQSTKSAPAVPSEEAPEGPAS